MSFSGNISDKVPLYTFLGNFGDALSPYLVKKIANKEVHYLNLGFNNKDRNDFGYMAVGSIASLAGSSTKVWGSGILDINLCPSKDAEFFAVRGPITRMWLEFQGFNVPEIYGDPALLLPRFYNKEVKIKHKIGIIPHYIHSKLCKEKFEESFIIDLSGHCGNELDGKIETTIDKIRSCKLIVSTSLHGIIVAHAYGIPAIWATFSASKQKLLGGKWQYMKFQDYYLSVGLMPPKSPLDLSNKKITSKFLSGLYLKSPKLNINLKDLFDSCPIPKKCSGIIEDLL
tara:strand:+ start:99 stop:953 length:855 start_codon:yes stop_codon:yes gene_type:complete